MNPRHWRKQPTRGFALISVLILLSVITASYLVSAFPFAGNSLKYDATTSNALAIAKTALMGRSAADASRPGSLPCPDLVTNISGNNIPGDGKADLLSGNHCPSYVGWLPWRTLGLPELRDGSGHRLWYALSSSLRDDISAEPINSNTVGNLHLDSISDVAAIIFAPGTSLTGQLRPSNNASDYLDGSNATPNQTHFVSGQIGPNFNDRALAITRSEMFAIVSKRVLAEIRGTGSPATNGLLKYQADNGGLFPWADSDVDGIQNPGQTTGQVPINDLNAALLPAWIKPNRWHTVVNYTLPGPAQSAIIIQLNGNLISCVGTTCQ